MVSRALGLASRNWLGDPQLALISVIAIHTWQWTPFAFLVLLATLSTLPPDVYEAARIDRAGAWQRFRHLTLPLIRPAIVMVVILRTMTALSAFAAIFAATGGGPGSATEILNLYAYRTSFSELNLGYGASLAIVLLAITMLISYFMPGPENTYQSYGTAWANLSNSPFRLYKHWTHEGGIATPLIAHWPNRIDAKENGTLRHAPGYLPDIMPVLLTSVSVPAMRTRFSSGWRSTRTSTAVIRGCGAAEKTL